MTAQGWMKYGYRVFIGGLLCAIAYFGAIHLSNSLRSTPLKPPEASSATLIVPDGELDLGRVYETRSKEHPFHITNSSEQAVTITRFEKTCDCLGIFPSTDVALGPHETRTFTSKLSLISQTSSLNAEDGEPLQVQFGAIYSIDGQAPRSTGWQLREVLLPTIRFKPAVVQIGTVSDRRTLIERFVDVEATDHIQRIECSSSSQWGVEVTRNDQASSSNRFRMVVRSLGNLQPRQVSDTIRLTPVDREEKRLPDKELKIVGDIVRDVVAVPGQIHHGRQTCGASMEEAVQLRSLTGRGFSVTNVTAGTPDLEVKHIGDKTEDQAWAYSLRLLCSKPGEQEEFATFMIRDEDGTEFHVIIPVRYHGLVGS